MRCPAEDLVWLADGIKWQNEYDLAIEGTNYTLLIERVPETGINPVALLES